jgi:hypothetical protein
MGGGGGVGGVPEANCCLCMNVAGHKPHPPNPAHATHVNAMYINYVHTAQPHWGVAMPREITGVGVGVGEAAQSTQHGGARELGRFGFTSQEGGGGRNMQGKGDLPTPPHRTTSTTQGHTHTVRASGCHGSGGGGWGGGAKDRAQPVHAPWVDQGTTRRGPSSNTVSPAATKDGRTSAKYFRPGCPTRPSRAE